MSSSSLQLLHGLNVEHLVDRVENTLIITVVSVTLELILGMLIAQAMYRAIFARTVIRASVLVPYGAVTVVAAFAWRLAFDPATGSR